MPLTLNDEGVMLWDEVPAATPETRPVSVKDDGVRTSEDSLAVSVSGVTTVDDGVIA